jgi:hypothetical protein
MGKTLMRRTWSAVIALLVVALIGVGVWSVAHSNIFGAKYRIATYPGSVSMLALHGPATLAGQANFDGTACLWFEDGRNRTVLIWPSGYTARGQPLAVIDQNGNPVAVVGRPYGFGGGFSIQGGNGPNPVLGCGNVTSAWAVGPMRSAP